MKLRSLTIGLALVTSGTVIGVATQQFAAADISSGDRPVLVPIETCRLADTRPPPDNVGPRNSPLGAADTLTITAQQAGTDCTGKIPTDATALSLNVTALNTTSNSFLTVWPDGPRPTASALNPAPGARVFNAVTTELSPTQTFEIYNNRGTTDVFIDVNGYYANHNHDDLYAPIADVPEMYHAAVSSGSPAEIVRSSDDVSLNQFGNGFYVLTFPRDVTDCFWNATLGGGEVCGSLLPASQDLGIAANQAAGVGFVIDPDAVLVSIYDPAANPVNAPFTLTVTCP